MTSNYPPGVTGCEPEIIGSDDDEGEPEAYHGPWDRDDAPTLHPGPLCLCSECLERYGEKCPD